MLEVNEFNAIRISLASPDQIRTWSSSEVTKPETINYRTLRPEKDGLFDVTHIDEHQRERVLQQISEEAEGKIRRLEQTISDRTGAIESRASAEIMRIRTSTEQKVRQQEEQLATDSDALTTAAAKVKEQLEEAVGKPASKDIIFKQADLTVASKGENVTRSMLTELQRSLQKQLDALVKAGRKEEEQSRSDADKRIADIRMRADQDLGVVRQDIAPDVQVVRDEARQRREDVESIKPQQTMTEADFRAYAEKYRFFRAQMGAEAILEIIRQIDLDDLSLKLQAEMRSTTGQRRKKSIKRLRLVKALLRSGASPEWMILTILPVIPPALRPMVHLDGGPFAASDLNDLYRRGITRTNPLTRLLALAAPATIIRSAHRASSSSAASRTTSRAPSATSSGSRPRSGTSSRRSSRIIRSSSTARRRSTVSASRRSCPSSSRATPSRSTRSSARPSAPTSTATRWPCTCRSPRRRRPRQSTSCSRPATS